MNKYVCIHGHFYQPPRENPWLEYIEHQAAAYPYHDWNEKIAEECYTPNSASRLVNNRNKIVDIVNNYASLSFNFGPTLISWLAERQPDTYEKIIEADRLSGEEFSGHGSAIAQAYNHMILPLANGRDRRTQIRWGIRDFQKRFGRAPEGMWLPETAVDMETLGLLADEGIAFTILAPRQAAAVRRIGEDAWTDVTGSTIDPKRAYRCFLSGGKSIALFFYDGPASQSVGFDRLLSNGRDFADRLLGLFTDSAEPQLVHIANDGETYGHHHVYGDMSLAYCLRSIREKTDVRLTNYGEFLSQHPPEHEVSIIENSSWSCVHGVERWKSDCGCSSLQHPDWHQRWREPLRNALDWLRDAAAARFEQAMAAFTADPWKARDDYIDVILDRSPENVDRFLSERLSRPVDEREKITVLKLLEMQRHALLMYTSCGWFFDDVSGIESTQVLKYAARVAQLHGETSGRDVEGELLRRLEGVPTNVTRFANGRGIYESFVKPSSVDMLRVCAHFAMSSLFREYGEGAKVYCFRADRVETDTAAAAGKRKYLIGRAELRSEITCEKMRTAFTAVYRGDNNLSCGTGAFADEESYQAMRKETLEAFAADDAPRLVRLLAAYYGDNQFSLTHLFQHEQQTVYREIFAEAITSMEAHSRQIYAQYYPLLKSQKRSSFMFPKILAANIEFVINRDILNLLKAETPDTKALNRIANEIKDWSFEIDRAIIGFTANHALTELLARLLDNPADRGLLATIRSLLVSFKRLDLQLHLWRSQNAFFTLMQRIIDERNSGNAGKDFPADAEWSGLVNKLAAQLYIGVRL
ncbi:MAG: DUF3536 domain-containing protein [Spirochaetales bacterium]|nr:DUF3536 domain-containing protein [Spirochaetales bacterium]